MEEKVIKNEYFTAHEQGRVGLDLGWSWDVAGAEGGLLAGSRELSLARGVFLKEGRHSLVWLRLVSEGAEGEGARWGGGWGSGSGVQGRVERGAVQSHTPPRGGADLGWRGDPGMGGQLRASRDGRGNTGVCLHASSTTWPHSVAYASSSSMQERDGSVFRDIYIYEIYILETPSHAHSRMLAGFSGSQTLQATL